jgi:hypothetical protein
MDAFERTGRAWRRGALSAADVDAWRAAIGGLERPGARLACGADDPLLRAPTEIAQDFLPGAIPVRVVAFHKSESLNWGLGWHQDRVIAVRARVDCDGFFNWTRKDGVWHVEPPIALLERMVFLRLHLDPATAANGCMQIAVASHGVGRVLAAAAKAMASAAPVEDCAAKVGDVLIAKALLLHRSAPSQSATHRRAVRIDFSAVPLPPGLAWA